jgi:hypothetical protein
VVGQLDGVWGTFLRDERGLVEELTLVEHPDERSAVTEFMSQLQNAARLENSTTPRRSLLIPPRSTHAATR